MNEEIDPKVQNDVEEKLKTKNRIEQLSEKVILTSKERDEFSSLNKTLTSEKDSLSKERDFYKDFSANVSKYPGASEYQDKILEKVRAGYSTEDAMISVLAKEGKFSQPAQQNVQVEGGSAITTQPGPKSPQEMSQSERLAALSELEKSGDLVNAFLGR